MNCADSDKNEYFWIMHSVFILSLPVYIVAIIALLQTKSPYFKTYKIFLIWHTSTNLLAELLNSWFLNPVVHLPLPLLRFTGIFSQLGFKTAYSVFEMFLFRFRASILDYKSSGFYLYLRINTYIFRAVLISFVLINCFTYHIGLEYQSANRQNLLVLYPEAPVIVTCFTVIVAAPFVDPYAMFNMIIWMLVVLVTLTSTLATTVYLRRHLKENAHQSEAVVRMHKMLLITLSVQTAIHLLMLGVPNSLFIVAAFIGVRHESIAKISFIFLTIHGFSSTVAMVLLTKPIKISVIQMLKCKSADKFKEDTRRMSNKL
ncbi:CBN-SRH-17 protein [Caenorhabditis brenneri]|uniref:CBN-SRH-17 protein n=1 Tax=Caenorhabditis brenneri TaxID=135651 RepID=G0NWS7_CAEBE|nr:CBN-SRH-17 protein [Caenorhabditis brenneri]